MSLHPLSGVYAAALTPLKADYSLDLESVPVFLDFLARRGCHGALLLGTTGEGPSFSPGERLALFKAALKVRESHPDFRLLGGTGTPSLTETAELNRAAFDLGFDGVVCLPPFYYRTARDEGLFDWFESVITRSVPPDRFLLGYHFPAVAGIGFSIPLLTRLKDAFPVQFAGIKDSSHDVELAHQLGERFGDELLVLTGTDSYLQLAMENHAGGCITAPANLLSPGLREVWDAIQGGGSPARAQARVSEQRRLLEKYPPFPPTLKALLSRLHPLPRWAVRPPLEPMAEAALESALADLARPPLPEIRAEEPSDSGSLGDLVQAAFGGEAEARLVDLLRQRGRNIVSLVAVEAGQVVGQVLFTEVSVTPPAPFRGVGLAPLAVLPAWQRRGLGTELTLRGLALCRERGYDFAVVLGSPKYYPRFGYKRASDFGLGNDYHEDDPFMALEFKPGVLGSFNGIVHYSPEFVEAGC